MFVEMKTLAAIDSLSARVEADTQMRQRFVDFYDASPAIFTGISAFGHIVCKYELNKDDGNRITPAVIQNSADHVIDVAPRGRWGLDLTTAEGAARIQAIFQEVRKSRMRCSMKMRVITTLQYLYLRLLRNSQSCVILVLWCYCRLDL